MNKNVQHCPINKNPAVAGMDRPSYVLQAITLSKVLRACVAMIELVGTVRFLVARSSVNVNKTVFYFYQNIESAPFTRKRKLFISKRALALDSMPAVK